MSSEDVVLMIKSYQASMSQITEPNQPSHNRTGLVSGILDLINKLI